MAIIFASYALHVHYRPFLEHNDDLAQGAKGIVQDLRQANEKIATDVYVSGRSFSCWPIAPDVEDRIRSDGRCVHAHA
jgi:hypothetical protein